MRSSLRSSLFGSASFQAQHNAFAVGQSERETRILANSAKLKELKDKQNEQAPQK